MNERHGRSEGLKGLERERNSSVLEISRGKLATGERVIENTKGRAAEEEDQNVPE